MDPDELESFALLLVHVSNLAQPMQLVVLGSSRCGAAPPRPDEFHVGIISQPKLQTKIGFDRHKSSEGSIVSHCPWNDAEHAGQQGDCDRALPGRAVFVTLPGEPKQ